MVPLKGILLENKMKWEETVQLFLADGVLVLCVH